MAEVTVIAVLALSPLNRPSRPPPHPFPPPFTPTADRHNNETCDVVWYVEAQEALLPPWLAVELDHFVRDRESYL